MENPCVPANKLLDFDCAYKIKLRSAGYRLVYVLLPAREPLGQIAGVAQTAETAIDDFLVAPHHPGPVATGHARFDVLTVKPQVTLDIEPVRAASHRAVGVDQAGPRRLVQHRADDGA